MKDELSDPLLKRIRNISDRHKVLLKKALIQGCPDYFIMHQKGRKVRFFSMEDKKIFVLNEDGVAEYIAAIDKDQALKFAGKCWGKEVVDEYFKEYIKDNPDSNWDEFVEDFVREMPCDEEFSLYSDYNSTATTKTIKEFLQDIKEIPSYFACSEF